jgi:lipoprotein-anchoring transpeptidase ErfK/SrfK
MKISCLRMLLVGLVFGLGTSATLALTAEQVNAARFVDRDGLPKTGPDPFIVKAQALLSRRSISPGVIDGVDGENFRQMTWLNLAGETANDIIVEYRLSPKDVSYDYADSIPRDYARQAKMKRLSYTSPQEMLGERFHMSEKLLDALNPGERFSEGGASVFVVASRRSLEKGSGERIDAVKSTGMVLVFGAEDKVLASYPATIGSEDNPSPTGDFTIERVARNPNYTYDPEKNFQQGRNTDTLVLPPGPNNPVGTVWIALSKPTFGIHGTPEPSRVSKTTSHGCVRLTNWDAEELADLVKPGVTVRFLD